MAMIGKMKKIYEIPKPVRLADEIELDDESSVAEDSQADGDLSPNTVHATGDSSVAHTAASV